MTRMITTDRMRISRSGSPSRSASTSGTVTASDARAAALSRFATSDQLSQIPMVSPMTTQNACTPTT